MALYTLIEEYYETRITMGFYRNGDSLPSILDICAMFHVAPATARAALHSLEKRGHLRIDARRTAKVIDRADPAAKTRSAAVYFAQREDGMRDIFEGAQLLFEPLWQQGIAVWGKEHWQLLAQSLAVPPRALTLPVRCYAIILNTLHNGLALNFFWEVIRYLRFPYLLPPARPGAQEKLPLPGDGEQAWTDWLGQYLRTLSATRQKDLLSFVEKTKAEFQLEQIPQIPFRWSIYHRRPQFCYSLVAQLLRDIASLRLTAGEYLPSLPQLAQQTGTSVSTVRRTLRILEALGMTESQQGRGTLVCAAPARLDVSMFEVQEGLRFYREALQMLALTIRGVCGATLEAAPADARAAFRQKFLLLLEQGQSQYSFESCLAFIASYGPSALVRECYGELRGLLFWGYPLALLRLDAQRLDEAYHQIVRRAVDCLKAEDWAGFAAVWEELMAQEERNVDLWFVQNGLDALIPVSAAPAASPGETAEKTAPV